MEEHDDTIMQSVQDNQDIPKQSDVLVASLDGTNVLLREKGCQKGRPAERPGRNASSSENTAYRNAMTGAISFYELPCESQKRPQRLQSSYIGRMPEKGAVTFKRQFEQEVLAAQEKVSSATTKIFLCDGQRSIWSYANSNPIYEDYEKLIDFYHTSEHLSKAGEALFGKNSKAGKSWYQKYYRKLLEDEDGPDSVLRSMRYYGQTRKLSKNRREVLKQQKTFFKRNKDKMNYAEFIARGLPIGSRPVEAACKSIIKTRLCRSGMR